MDRAWPVLSHARAPGHAGGAEGALLLLKVMAVAQEVQGSRSGGMEGSLQGPGEIPHEANRGA